MKISAFSASADSFNARELATADFVAIHGNCETDIAQLHLGSLSGNVHGATSCLGAMTHEGVSDGISIFAVEDPEGAYGSAVAEFEEGSVETAREATLAALRAADRLGEAPELIWLSCTPGTEEEVIIGIEMVVGSEVPIIGGSAADNSVSGDWFIFDRERICPSGVVVSVMFPSRPVSFAYHNGHAPTGDSGRVTKVSGRQLLEIDHRPAFEVFNEWNGGQIKLTENSNEMQSILSESTLIPLGRKVVELGGVEFFLLAHPANASNSGAIDLFATVEEGEVITQMTGTETGLVKRAGRVASLARSAGRMEHRNVSGALVVYCGGCMLTVRDRMHEVVDGITDALGRAPFLGTFTFGEQGKILGAGNRHGNLMISCIVFG